MSNVNLETLIDRLENILESGTSLALTKRIMVDGDALGDIIEDLRLSVPEEIKQAKAIAADRMTILNSAKKDGDRIIARAQEQAMQLISKDEITRKAQAQANEILSKAKAAANLEIATAKEKAQALLAGANQEAKSVTAQAEKWSKDMKSAASDFVTEIMSDSERTLEKSLHEVRRVQQNLKSSLNIL